MKTSFKKLGLLTAAAFALVACSNGASSDDQASSDSSAEPTKLKVGVVGDVEREVWEDVAERAKDKGVDLDVQVFTDYVQPNKALADGSLDLNAFQHMAFLHDFNSSEQQDLQPVGYTYISAMAAYSDKVESLDDLKDGAEIAIPNDATNGGRALLLLELAGVIEIDDNAGISPTPNDITENPKNVKITELDAAQVPRSLGDADAVVANTNYAVDAGLNPFKDGIFVDTEDLAKVGTQYKCIIATQKDRANDEAIKKVVETYQTPETEAKIKEVTDGADQKAWSDNDNISADYKALDEQVKAAKKK
ncbi:MetQ/NlpA family ABC transporter substrate-binding protein [Aerococcus sp. UMB10185]|uniref:MetQ/NlpA family ABC transporter substrate-binding protein n=1 Tax=unclassified Aerococcus TaxID=2618060 RepID=UPI0008A2820D|nr:MULTISPECIES: MetQ/NlpA family ABC transporter substrate-binding protein [unclassified Aerococcus]MDK6232897.1 MetQ/NlpA family ABC transporter substrate-binding protein [Aerococcus sp. UMB10185]MDK6855787.1 MetQ/NlpA family ABC transporter substrate-binding protein [Aerococcus sp. UMB7533]MDK8502528.1 MetQ/NlpA family ABC transporter substrate-binding protein [Aerococcus sp. UMB1112A]OFN03028.1 methionine ABC transporter substrate-binding protein [Aerococcus sp. HMSC062A02]OHO45296.1 methi